MNPGRLAENVRRAAGAHLVSLDSLAQHVGMTRGGLMKLLADDGRKRTTPKATTAMALAEAFGVDVRDLMEDDPRESLRAVLESFERAPIRAAAKVPESDVRIGGTKIVHLIDEEGVVVDLPLKSKRKGKR